MPQKKSSEKMKLEKCLASYSSCICQTVVGLIFSMNSNFLELKFLSMLRERTAVVD